MFRYAILGLASVVASSAWAQQASPPAEAPPSSSAAVAESPKPVVAMEEPKPGDHWTYEIQDEIIGKISATRENVVTEVTPANISIRVKTVGNTNEGLNVYDRSWNLVESPPWRYSPNDGSGIRSPLAVGKTWPVQTNNINGTTGNIWKRSGTSKVVGQESVTTKAGTFDTFKIETTFTGSNLNNPTVKNEVTSQTWYAPAIDHWVKRTFVSRTNKHLLISNTFELIEYGRRQ
jgi:hypothetical protein